MRYFFRLLLTLAYTAGFAQQKLDYNSGFEQAINIGKNWQVFDLDRTDIFSTDSIKRSGHYSLMMDGKDSKRTPSDDDAPFTQLLVPAELMAGKKRLKLVAWMKKDRPAIHAGIWLIQVPDMSNMTLTDVVTGDSVNSRGWQQIILDLPVKDSAKVFAFGTLLNGPGRAWFDDFALYLDGVLVRDSSVKFNELSQYQKDVLNSHALELTSTSDTNINSDLDSFALSLRNVKVIGIGEPTHGNHEAEMLKQRIFKYLVEQEGFDTWLTEDNYGECSLIDKYVQGSVSEWKKEELFQGSRNKEVSEFIEWMRTYNQTHEKKIHFAGYDLQSAWRCLENISLFAGVHDVSALPAINNLKQSSAGLNKNWYDTAGIATRWEKIMSDSREVQKIFEKWKNDLNLVSADSLAWLKQHQKILSQFFKAEYKTRTVRYRDSCMAENILDLTSLWPHSRYLLSAHNVHIAVAGFGSEFLAMGSWLDKLLGDKYFRMGILIQQGTYSAARSFTERIYETCPLVNPLPGTAEYYFGGVSKQDYILSFTTDLVKANPWISKDIAVRNIGFIKAKRQFYQKNLYSSFNAIAFIRKGTPMQLLKGQ